MKLDRLETHDRLQHFLNDQSNIICQGAEDCLKKNTDSLKYQEKCHYVYLFAHPRTDDDGLNKRLLWQPRLLKPKAQTNSYLFRAQSNTDIVEICWILPPREMWPQYNEGNVTESDWVRWSIDQFENNRRELEKPFPDDLTEDQAMIIFKAILRESIHEKKKSNLNLPELTAV